MSKVNEITVKRDIEGSLTFNILYNLITDLDNVGGCPTVLKSIHFNANPDGSGLLLLELKDIE